MTAAIKRSPERLVFYYKTADTPTTVKRDTLRRAARKLGLDETGFLHLAAAQMLEDKQRNNSIKTDTYKISVSSSQQSPLRLHLA